MNNNSTTNKLVSCLKVLNHGSLTPHVYEIRYENGPDKTRHVTCDAHWLKRHCEAAIEWGEIDRPGLWLFTGEEKLHTTGRLSYSGDFEWLGESVLAVIEELRELRSEREILQDAALELREALDR